MFKILYNISYLTTNKLRRMGLINSKKGITSTVWVINELYGSNKTICIQINTFII